jgi:hypothetical protein
MKSITIFDSENNYLSFDLRDILKLIYEGETLNWTLQEMDFNTLEPSDIYTNMTDDDFAYLESIMKSEKYSLSWDKLLRISSFNIQILNGEICGENEKNIIRINIFDGSYWTVETNIESLIEERIKVRFKEYKVV